MPRKDKGGATNRHLYKTVNVITSMQLNSTVLKRSTILLVVLILPFNAIHEVGHLIPCVMNGGQGTFVVGIVASQATCSILSQSIVFFFAGGLLAGLVAILPLTIKRIAKYPSIRIVLLALAIGHFMTALLESFAREFYMSDIATIIVSFATFSIYIVVLCLFGRKEKLTKDQWITSMKAGELFKRNTK